MQNIKVLNSSCFTLLCRIKNDGNTRSGSPIEEKNNVKNKAETAEKLKNFENAIKNGTSKE